MSSRTYTISYGDETPAEKGVSLGSAETSVRRRHVYSKEGTYLVQVTDEFTGRSVVRPIVIKDATEPVIAVRNVDGTRKVEVELVSALQVTDYEVGLDLDWGDGEVQWDLNNARKYVHTYARSGTYTVSVTNRQTKSRTTRLVTVPASWVVEWEITKVVDLIPPLATYKVVIKLTGKPTAKNMWVSIGGNTIGWLPVIAAQPGVFTAAVTMPLNSTRPIEFYIDFQDWFVVREQIRIPGSGRFEA